MIKNQKTLGLAYFILMGLGATVMSSESSLDQQILFSKSVGYHAGPGEPNDYESVTLYASGKLVASGYANWESHVSAHQLENIKTYIRHEHLLTASKELLPATPDMHCRYSLFLDGDTNNLEYGDRTAQMKALEKMIFENQPHPNPLAHA